MHIYINQQNPRSGSNEIEEPERSILQELGLHCIAIRVSAQKNVYAQGRMIQGWGA